MPAQKAESRDLNLTRREADITLRLARPTDDAGSRVLSKRIATLTYAAYVANDVDAGTEKLPWLTYEEGMADLPQARWIAKVAESGGILSPLAVNDAEAMLQGVQVGLGRGLLPCIVADQISSLRRIHLDELAFPEREIWLLTHPDLRHLTRIAAVLAWIEASIRKLELASLSARKL
ncbi:hypothetical protein LAV84_23080 [Rhizobium sp. VS19-DR104.2]|uniref:LysR substrate-binding domain-containing protein n=1 Tax=unclassified Rhizobium TaxID=2613769 RepID=UPI001C5B0107|nr:MULTISPECIES: LysR substrate-binding domain-containing protein [unclassified Rhizobium]MBZ5762084.1 hypothetical protein [Rhizobium sp. VS19-DR96]MBZ5768197.1 hypothetical protein [Rhizobium sp. VS19-DR129.2]MBZ5775738.1 hypothetical protein [Rhizobium sp. VS19-DRK62.2]MBZ5786961.1 hypothetical protein [Rhizobium sp. VS19-DR121]MBZ5804122.1 hypothetical protein [Rhizobium sp. VS19-DR181]